MSMATTGPDAGTNYIRQVLPLTRDLDKVSAELFKLTTNGGSEYCGAVIREAIDKLEWAACAKDLQNHLHRGQRAVHPGAGEPRRVMSFGHWQGCGH